MVNNQFKSIPEYKILITGGAGFIGSNLCEALLAHGSRVWCLDNFATGKRVNIEPLLENPNFQLMEGDIRNLNECKNACEGMDYVLHQAALGSVPRSIKDPITSNDDSENMPKVEDIIGKPRSPYAITKYVNELYADIFSKTYGMETIGLRYFNVFGRKQDPNGAYAAVIPKFVMQLMKHESPVINGDGSYSRDFTYIDNVLEMNIRAMVSENPDAVNTVYNVAYGERTDLNELVGLLKDYLSKFDAEIADVNVEYGPKRQGDVPHSLASIEKAKKLLGYDPQFNIQNGLKEAVTWYWQNFK